MADILLFSFIIYRAVPDFGSGSSQKPTIFTNPAQIWLWQKCSRISVFLARFAKWPIQILQCSIFQLVLKNWAVDVAMISIRFFTLLRSCHHLATDEISHYEYCMQIVNGHRVEAVS